MKRIVSTALMLMLIILCVYSQSKYKSQDVVRDIDNYSIYTNLSSNKSTKDSLYYIRYNGELIKLNCDVKYWGGDDKLTDFIDRIYYNRNNYNYQEMKDRVCFCIIFDEYLHIQDIRFTKRFHDLNDNLRNYIMVNSILLNTEGHWFVENKHVKSWHIYIGCHMFY